MVLLNLDLMYIDSPPPPAKAPYAVFRLDIAPRLPLKGEPVITYYLKFEHGESAQGVADKLEKLAKQIKGNA